jgi:hypothetical protein
MAYGTGAAYLNVSRCHRSGDARWTQGTSPDAPSDRTVAVLSFGTDDRPITAYVTHAMHRSTDSQGVVTADFPGAMSRYVEKAFGDETVVAFVSRRQDQNHCTFALRQCDGKPRQTVTGFAIDRESSEGPVRMDPGSTADPKSIDSCFDSSKAKVRFLVKKSFA